MNKKQDVTYILVHLQLEHYMQLMLEGTHTKEQRLRMLNRRRSDALDEIHWKEKQLERQDYLCHSVKISQEKS